MTPSVSTPTSPLMRKRRTHSEMVRGSFPSSSPSPTRAAAAAIAAAAENVASSIDFDYACSSSSGSSPPPPSGLNSPSCGSSTTSSSEDEEKQPLMKKQQEQKRQSLLRQSGDQEQTYQRSQFHLQQRQPGLTSFPHIDLNIPNLNMNLPNMNMNMNMNLNVNMNMNMNMNLHIENFDFHQLPVEIQMALEDTLLGWTHLSSITIGHVLLPWLVYCAIQRASKYVLETTVYTLQTIVGVDPSVEGGFEHAIETVLISPATHSILGAVAAIAAFRVIRHRRRVWFRHAYGSKAYKQCEEGRRRRAAVLEADRQHSSLLSLSSENTANEANVSRAGRESPTQAWTRQVFSNFKLKRHKKKLKKALQRASDRFERHHTGLSPRSANAVSSIPTTKSQRNGRKSKFWQKEDNYDSMSVTPTEDSCSDSSSTSSRDEGCSPKSTTTSETAFTTSNNGPNKTSIAHDAVSIPRIHNVPYAHGGFFGAAPFFLADKRWVKILRELLPDVYVEISRRVGGGYYYSKKLSGHDYRQDASKLIHWAENNPVVAAYGVVMDLQMKQELAESSNQECAKPKALTKSWKKKNFGSSSSSGSIIDQFYQTDNSDGDRRVVDPLAPITSTQTRSSETTGKMEIPNLEWDIFVDPQLVRRVEAVLDAMDRYIVSKTKPDSFDTKKDAGIATAAAADKNTSDVDHCAFCKGNDDETDDDALLDEDDGKSEADALLADHDHNSSNSAIGINNLCGSSAANLVCDCFQHNNQGTSQSPNAKPSSDYFVGDDARPTSEAWPLGLKELPDLKHDPVLCYLERELEKRTQELTDRLLIAHGNVLQLILEQAGILKDWNYSRVQRTRRTLGGGMYARQWMAVFAESLRLGMKPTKAASKRACSKSHKRSPKSEEETFNFYEEDDSSSTPAETDALLPFRVVEEEEEEEDVYEIDDDDSLDADREDPLEDDQSHCTCSPRCCLDTTMVESLKLIEKITQTKHPIGILLDLKSRHVPKRVLSLMVRSLQAAGIRVVGIASFQISEIRGVCSGHPQHNAFQQFGGYNSCLASHPAPTSFSPAIEPPTSSAKEILMVHSAGDLQAACDEGLVRPGDHVFFNGGSLILDSARSSTIRSLFGFFFDMCACGYYNTFDPCVIEDGYKIQSYGYACNGMESVENAVSFCGDTAGNNSFAHDGATSGLFGSSPKRRKTVHGLEHHHNIAFQMSIDDDDDDTLLMTSASEETEMGAVMKTLADYKKHYGFSMGLYLQEFSIDEAAARLLVDLVNQNPKLYDLGLAWGGINGMTVHGIQPGRFTSTDGYWNQRRLGRTWKDPPF